MKKQYINGLLRITWEDLNKKGGLKNGRHKRYFKGNFGRAKN